MLLSFRSAAWVLLSSALLTSCSTQFKIFRVANKQLLSDSVIRHAHLGIALYDPANDKDLFRYHAKKYFIPASNTKIVTCYAALKHLGDSLPGILYAETPKGLLLKASGDPTLLHPDYPVHPVIGFLKNQPQPLWIQTDNWKSAELGSGWSWDDYNDSYMVERSGLPVYGNVLRWYQDRTDSPNVTVYSLPETNWKIRFNPQAPSAQFHVQRLRHDNQFFVTEGKEDHVGQEVPFMTKGYEAALELLKDTLRRDVREWGGPLPPADAYAVIHSQPLDSLLRPMMHRSDNFFAEQSLLMVSQALLGSMNDEKVIQTLLKTDLNDLPQPPTWVDGSGLSRYNLFTPSDFIHILGKIRNEFGMERVKALFPTGTQGSLSNLYRNEAGAIYAKTGTLGGVVTLSGYLQTQKGKWLLFSVMVNNHRGSASHIRLRIQEFLRAIRERY